MKQMTPAAVERAMKLQDVMLRAMAKRITGFQAAEILGISCRQMQRWHTRFEHEGYEGLFDSKGWWNYVVILLTRIVGPQTLKALTLAIRTYRGQRRTQRRPS